MELRAIGDWLLEKDAQAQNALRYYLGPAYEPVNALAQFGAMMSPGADMMDMAQSSNALMNSPTWKDAGLNALGLGAATLGAFIPGTARGIEEAVDTAGDAVRKTYRRADFEDAIRRAQQEYDIVGLRTVERGYDPLAASHRWDDGIRTDEALGGVSVTDAGESNLWGLHQFDKPGAGGYYPGEDTYVVVGNSADYGDDIGERIISDPSVFYGGPRQAEPADDSMIEILRKYGLLGMIGGGAGAAAMSEDYGGGA